MFVIDKIKSAKILLSVKHGIKISDHPAWVTILSGIILFIWSCLSFFEILDKIGQNRLAWHSKHGMQLNATTMYAHAWKCID